MSRLMDRPLRPAMHPGWNHETQLLSWVLSYDNTHPPVPLAITTASAALALSNVPLVRAIAGVTVSARRGEKHIGVTVCRVCSGNGWLVGGHRTGDRGHEFRTQDMEFCTVRDGDALGVRASGRAGRSCASL